MRFSIIIPTYNRAELIKATVRSALDQSFDDFEVIVVDDGSTDNTREIVAKLEDEKVSYYWKENAERAAARNHGVDKAKGEYVTFLDSDDILYSNYLELANSGLQKNSDPSFFHQGYEMLSEDGSRIGLPEWPFSNDLLNIARGNPMSCLGVFIKREVFEKFRFNEDRNLSASEDWELWIRLICNYDLKRDDKIAAALISHSDRSVLEYDEEKLRKRSVLAIKYAFEDQMVSKKLSDSKNMISAYWDTYIALHLALVKKFKPAMKYWSKAVGLYPRIFFTRRSLVILRLAFFRM